MEDGTYTKEMFKLRSEAVSQSLTQINNSIKKYKIKLLQEEANKNEIIVPHINNLLDIYSLLQTPEEKNSLLKTLLTRSYIFKNREINKKRFWSDKFYYKFISQNW